LVESVRTDAGPRQHVVAYLGELNYDQQRRWQRTAVFYNRQGDARQLRWFPDDERIPLPDDPDVVRIRLSSVGWTNARSFGDVWLARRLWGWLHLDEIVARHVDNESGKPKLACLLGCSLQPNSRKFPGRFPMTFGERISEYVSAAFTGLWIQSFEHEDALVEIAQMCRQENWRLALWDIDAGLQIPGQVNGESVDAGGNDPLAAIRALNALASPDSSALLVLVNFHRFINNPEVIQATAKQIAAGKNNRTFVVVLSPVVEIPVELEKQFIVVEHELPNREQARNLISSIAIGEGEIPDGPELENVLDAAAGLTRYEAEGAVSLSLVRHGRVTAESVWELKSQMLKKSGLLSLHRGGDGFANLGGLDAMKSFCLRAMVCQGHRDPLRRPCGVLLLGVPGTGKSAFAKARAMRPDDRR